MGNQMGGNDLNQWIDREEGKDGGRKGDEGSWREGKSTAILDGILDLTVDESDRAETDKKIDAVAESVEQLAASVEKLQNAVEDLFMNDNANYLKASVATLAAVGVVLNF